MCRRPAEFFFSRRLRGSFVLRKTARLFVTPACLSCVCTYTQQLSTYAVPSGSADAWKIRFKGIMHVLTCLTRAYSGMYNRPLSNASPSFLSLSRYVNFGVFALYNDTCLLESLQAGLRLISLSPVPEMISFPKLSKTLFAFIHTLCTGLLPPPPPALDAQPCIH